MEAWSHESFGNDDACDWASELEEEDDLSLVEETLDVVLEAGDDDLEAPDASEAIAAAEVVARLLGRFGVRDGDTEGVDAWVEDTALRPSPELVEKALRALDRILTEPSELLELWRESDDGAAWEGAVRDLKARVAG